MANDIESTIKQFGGQKNDEDPKQVPPNFFSQIYNFNYPDDGILGMIKILMPELIKTIGTAQIDGLFEYRYLDGSNVLQTENIAVTAGVVYKNCLATSPTALNAAGMSAGKCSFVVFNDKLYIANGLNYVKVYNGLLGVMSEMGAPWAVGTATGGNVNVGAHYYAMTYVTAGGEEVLGSVSNTVTIASTAKQVVLTLPLGYASTLTRNIYRTEAAGTQLKLLYSVPDNTTTTYTDNTADSGLGGNIPSTGIYELPKPYFLTVANQKLYASKVTKYPTQVFISETNIDVLKTADGLDIANYGDDNTAVTALGFDYNKVVVGTSRNIIFIDPVTGDVVRTRGYVGIKDGYSLRLVPSYGDFPGGLMFVSSLNDVRLLQGTQAAAVFQTIDNLRTDSWSQNIRGDLNAVLPTYSAMYAEFYANKYHLAIDDVEYVFDIRLKGWTKHLIKSATYQSKPRVYSLLSNKLYSGQPTGGIELKYSTVTYRTESVNAMLQSPYLEVSRLWKWAGKLVFWFKNSIATSVTINAVTDENSAFPVTATLTLTSAPFNSTYFNSVYFQATAQQMDYRVFNITRPVRWVQWQIDNTTGSFNLQGWGAVGQGLTNKEK